MKLERLDRASLAPYLPIPRARDHLAMIATFIAFSAATWAWFLTSDMQDQPTQEVITAALIACSPLLGIVGLVWNMLWQVPECDGNTFKWTRHFVDRNVYGYRLWCCIDESGTTSYELLSIRNEVIRFSPSAEPLFAIGIATNDFKPCLARYRGATFDIPLQRMRKAGIFPEKETVYVRLHDFDGDIVTFEIRDLLAILRERSLEPDRFIGGLNTHYFLVKGLIDRNRQLEIERAALLTERLERDKAVGDIEEAVAQLDATKRFVRSKEGGAVRVWLGEKLATHLTFRDIPRRKREDAA